MNSEWIVRAVVLGVGGTVAMDLWAKFIRAAYGAQSLDYGLRADGAPLCPGASCGTPRSRRPGRSALSAERPTLGPVIGIAWATLAAPWLVMQPAMGLGIAGSKTPSPRATRLKSFATHTLYGLGVYLTAVATAGLRP